MTADVPRDSVRRMRRLLLVVSVAAWALSSTAYEAAATVRAEFADGDLSVTGDGDGNTITVGCANGNVRVNGGPPTGGQVGCSAVETILVRARAGADRVDLSDATRTAYTRLREVAASGAGGRDALVGSPGGDLLRGGDGNDRLVGKAGNDSMEGAGGNDALFGKTGNDTIRGGRANDELLGGPGADACVGGPGADSTLSC